MHATSSPLVRSAQGRPRAAAPRVGKEAWYPPPALPPARSTAIAPDESPRSEREDQRLRAIATAARKKKSADDVVAGLPGLIGEGGDAEHDRAQGQRNRRDAEGAPDAPKRQQATKEPAEVEQWREEVAIEGQHPDGVEEFGVIGVEPGQELRGEEMQMRRCCRSGRRRPRAARGTRSSQTRSSRCSDAGAPQRQSGSSRARQRADAMRVSSGEGEGRGSRPWQRPALAVTAGETTGGCTARRSERPREGNREEIGKRLEGTEAAEDSGDPDQQRQSQDRGRQPSRRARRARARREIADGRLPSRQSQRELRSQRPPAGSRPTPSI